jgi:hypothetical protein
MIGVVVDTIDKVIGISAESIQPSPPIFSDINLKYIMGVVIMMGDSTSSSMWTGFSVSNRRKPTRAGTLRTCQARSAALEKRRSGGR